MLWHPHHISDIRISETACSREVEGDALAAQGAAFELKTPSCLPHTFTAWNCLNLWGENTIAYSLIKPLLAQCSLHILKRETIKTQISNGSVFTESRINSGGTVANYEGWGRNIHQSAGPVTAVKSFTTEARHCHRGAWSASLTDNNPKVRSMTLKGFITEALLCFIPPSYFSSFSYGFLPLWFISYLLAESPIPAAFSGQPAVLRAELFVSGRQKGIEFSIHVNQYSIMGFRGSPLTYTCCSSNPQGTIIQ